MLLTLEIILTARRCVLVVVALETGGRWSREAAEFVEELSHARARAAPPLLRFAAALAWQRRWTRMLAAACGLAFAHSLVAPAGDLGAASAEGVAPPLSDLLARF